MPVGRTQRLVRRGDIFYFRAAVPKALQSAAKTTEIKLSLKTADRGTAVVRARYLCNAFDLLFGSMSDLPSPSLAKVDDAIRTYFQKALDRALQLSLDLPLDKSLDLDAEIVGLKQDLSELQDSLKKKAFNPSVKSDAEDILQKLMPNASHIPFDLRDYTATGVARAKIEWANYLIKALSGDYSGNTPTDPLFVGMKPETLEDFQTSSTALTLAQARKKFVSLKRNGTWVKKTELDYERVFDLAEAAIGAEVSVRTITADDMKRFRDALAQLPKNATKIKANRSKSLKELIEKNGDAEGLSTKTQAKYFAMWRGFLMWLQQEEEIPKLPGPNIKVVGQGKGNAKNDRYPYSPDQLKRTFSSPLFRGCSSISRRSAPGKEIIRDGYYWIPLIALYSGMRLGEIVQLATNDLKQEGNIWFFDVSLADGEGKHLKTGSSVRRVPVHQALIKLGLLDRLEHVKKLKKARLFYDIEPGKDGYFSHNFSKWWGRYSRKIGVHTEKTAFHSFRHNFTDALREADVPDSISKALVGHADKSVHAAYGKGVSLSKLSAEINKVAYDILI